MKQVGWMVGRQGGWVRWEREVRGVWWGECMGWVAGCGWVAGEVWVGGERVWL